jgi:hypothetical protein
MGFNCAKFFKHKAFCGCQAILVKQAMSQNYRFNQFCLLHVSDKKRLFTILDP